MANIPKVKLNRKVKIEEIIENETCSTAQVDPKVLNHTQTPKSKVRIEGITENKSCSTT